MKPKKQTLEQEQKAMCDMIVENAAIMMFQDVKAPFAMIVDRLTTYAVAQMVTAEGKEGAAAIVRSVALQIEGGAFDRVERGKAN